MYKKILVPLALDHGHGFKAMEVARKLRAEGGEIIALHVVEAVPSFARYYVTENPGEEIRDAAEKELAERIGEAKDADITVLEGHPGRTITDYAVEIGADCIVAGSHKRELQDFFLGSTAARIVRHAPCSVHVLR